MPKRSFRFGNFLRDSSDYDSPALDEARNVMPVHGVYRPVRKANRISSIGRQAELTPWIDFDGTANADVTFAGNPITATGGLVGKFTIIARCRFDSLSSTNWRLLGTSFLDTAATAGFQIELAVGVDLIVFDVGTGDGDRGFKGRSTALLTPETDLHTVVARSKSDTENTFDLIVNGNVSDEFTIPSINTTEWNAQTMSWGNGLLDGDIERVAVIDGESLSWEDAEAIADDPFEGLSTGGFEDGHLWLIRANTGTTVFDYASSGALDGTMDTGVTWEGSDFGTSVPSGITGGIAHFYTASQDDLVRFPDEDISNEDDAWASFGSDSGDNALPDGEFFSRTDEVSPDDSDGAFLAETVAGLGAAKSFEVKFNGMADPGVDTGHTINYRYRFNGAPDDDSNQPFTTMKVTPTLKQGTTTILALDAVEVEVADDEWHSATDTLTSGEASAITNYDNLRMEFDGEIVGGVRQDGLPESDTFNGDNWQDENGDTTDLFESINDDTDSTTFIQTPGISPGATTRYRTKLTSETEDPIHASEIRVEASAGLDVEGADLILRLTEDGVFKAGKTFTDIPTAQTTHTWDLTQTQIDRIEDSSALGLNILFKSHEDAGSTGSSGLLPESFDKQRGAVGSIEDIRAEDGNTLDVDSTLSGAEPIFSINMEAGDDPGTSEGHRIRVFAKKTGGNTNFDVKLKHNGSVVYDSLIEEESSRSLTNNLAEYTFDIPKSVIDGFNGNYSNIDMVVITRGGSGGGTANYDIIEFQYPGAGTGGRVGKVFWAKADLPSRAWIGISWVQFRAPDPDTLERPDITELYAGDYNTLYEVSDDGWTDVSKAGGYATTGETPRSWGFTTFGENVIATNKIDPVQVRSPGDSLFSDMITSTAKPQFATMCVVQNHLIGFNVEYTNTGQGSGGDGSPDEWWCSAFDDPEDFDIDGINQSNRKRIQEARGEIVGSVGGEFALAFKRDSIHRLDWVGGDAVFRQGVISHFEGTVYPRSIVQVGRDAYFLDHDGFKVVRNGTRVDRVGAGAVDRMVTDSAFEERALIDTDSDTTPLAESVIVGTYDTLTGLIWWAIRSDTDANPISDWKNGTFLIYNIFENRWAVVEVSGLTATHIWGLPPQAEASKSYARGVGVASISGGFPLDYRLNFERFLGTKTYESIFKTKIWSTEFIAGPEAVGRDYLLSGVRPSYRMAPESSDRPNLEILVEAADDPLMQFDVLEETKSQEDANNDQWYPFQIQGEYFTIQVTFPELEGQTIREINGVQLEFEDAGGEAGPE